MDVRLDLIGWSFGAGVFAFFNPCGFAMLPAYVAHYLGTGAATGERVRARLIGRGLALGGVVSGGFVTAFAALGLVVSVAGSAIARIVPWGGAVVGLGLIVLGVLMLLANTPLTIPAVTRLAAALPAPRGEAADGARTLPFYYSFGITYALASVGCTFPVFMIVVGNAFAGGVLNGTVQFALYAFGMALMMLLLSLAMVLSKTLVARLVPSLMRFVRPVGAVGVIAAGAYLIYYNLPVLRLLVA